MALHRQFAILAWVFVILFAGLVVFFAIFEGPYLSYPSLPLKVLGPAKPGESVRLLVTRCNSSADPLEYEVSHWLKDIDTTEPEIVLPTSRLLPLPSGCQTVISALNIVPLGTHPGRYIVGGIGAVRGVLRTFRVPWYSEPFDVTR